MKPILVTGANKGIGLATVQAILEQDSTAHVFLGSRDLERGVTAASSLTDARPEWATRLEVVEIDVSSHGSVARARTQLQGRLDALKVPLYGIVNNAGIGFGASDLERVLEVNTLGIYRVCEAFLPLLDPTAGRIANVTSAAGPNFVAECSQERQSFFVQAPDSWSQLHAVIKECLAVRGGDESFAKLGLANGAPYGLSKALANTYTLLLARDNPDLRINACTPGFIETDLTRSYALAQGKHPVDFGMKQPSEGTAATLFLLFGEPEGNGHYYGSDAIRSPLDRYRAPGTAPFAG